MGVKSNHVLFVHGGNITHTVTTVRLLEGTVTLAVNLAMWVAISSIVCTCVS